jgi:hypothetical protein
MSLFTKCLDQLRRRRWEHIRSRWLNDIPVFAKAGETPAVSLSDVVGFQAVAAALSLRAKDQAEQIRTMGVPPTSVQVQLISESQDVSGVREIIFRESLFLMHKARHVLGAAEFQARDGLRTWSLANSYQASFYAAKAILGFLGVSFPEYNSRTIIVDLFPYPVRDSREYTDAAFHFLGTRLDHRPVWDMFQRIIAVSSVDCWPKEIINRLKSVESKNFAKQRNDIHYRNNGWLLNDLHDFDFAEGFGSLRSWPNDNDDLDFDRDDVSIVVAFTLLKLGLMLIQDLGSVTGKLQGEIAVVDTCVELNRHPLYGSLLRSGMRG